MKLFLKIHLPILVIVIVFVFSSTFVFAQGQQTVQTTVGNISDPNPGGGGGGSNEDPPAGYFRPPFSCNIVYMGSTYSGPNHVWEVDFNRRTCGEDRGDPVRAIAPGLVFGVAPGRVIIAHKGGYNSLYGHMRNITVHNNQRVKMGQQIGEISDVGNATAPHLHLGIYRGSWPGGLEKIKFEGKGHPASLPGNRDVPYCPGRGLGPVSCKVLY